MYVYIYIYTYTSVEPSNATLGFFKLDTFFNILSVTRKKKKRVKKILHGKILRT